MKKIMFSMGVLALVLMGAGCEKSYEYEWSSESESDDSYEYSWGDYDSVPTADIEVPESVLIGEEFDIVATITHDSDEPQILHSIDIGQAYLRGIVIMSSEPEFTDSYLLDDGTYTHTLLTEVPVEGLDIVFHAVSMGGGDFTGAFDICFDDGLNCSFYTIETTVEVE